MRFCLTGYLRGFLLKSISPSKAQLGQQLRGPNSLLLSFRLPNTLSLSKIKQEGNHDNAVRKAPTESTPFEMANESVRLDQENVARASEFVSKVDKSVYEWDDRVKELYVRVKEWDDLVKVNLGNPEVLKETRTERDKAYERLNEALECLKEARESRDKAIERLEKAIERLEKLLKLRSPGEIVLKKIHERLDAMEEGMEYSKVGRSAILHSDWTVGANERKRLNDNGLVLEAEILEDEDPFLSQKEQHEVNGVKNESELISFLTPFFDAVLKRCDMVLVNSENLQLLPQSRNTISNIKPKLFSTHPGMFVKKDDRGATGRLNGEAVKELLDCIVLFEGKVEIDDAAFGQVALYLKHLNPKGSGIAILFDRTSFQMITSYRGKIVKVVKSKWVNEGSKMIFQNFILDNKPSWIWCLQEACDFF